MTTTFGPAALPVAGIRPAATLAQRLTRMLMLWVAAVWIVCVAGVVVFIHYQINHNFDNELEESGQRMLDIVTHNLDVAGRPADGAPPLVAPPPLAGTEDLVYRLVDSQGRPLLVSEPALRARFFGSAPLQQGFYNRDGWRIFTAVHPQRPLLLQLADPRPDRRRAVRRVLLGLAVPMLAVLAILPLLLGAVARRELRVLQRLEGEIAVRGGDDLRPLPLAGMPRELFSVGERVNLLLERLKQSLDVERALAANAAHELRTPLAAVRLRLQTALDAEGGVSPRDVQAAMTALDVLRHRTEKLLQLSRAESAAGLVQAPVDLVQLAATMAQEFWLTPALQERLVLRVPDGPVPAAQGDVDGLAIALRNLVENALRYGEGRGVEIDVQAPCVLVVRDHGPGVPPERLQALRSRHVRDTDSRAGYGLGLSIVSTIVERHRGRLELVSPLPDGQPGLEARIHLLPVI
ncbi:ATP-binding protein [Xylophilus sp. Leaf220]|uniref:ATP-binding protein n=1 Tax=Xylophilus sp. Leaf220 TaxID=1735686 RepID=UPI000700E9CB|nr:ATP-binding protein [Xylophilus sp. Leaf220]KQM68522.1 histidine kinase [Xylophilus sp. Leaf220]